MAIVLLTVVALPLAAWLLLTLLSETISAIRLLAGKGRATEPGAPPSSTRLLVLVPAHNESLLIEDCVRSLVSMRRDRVEARICVIADNCTDDTAARARAAGAEVRERFDRERRGKPFAIQWAVDELGLDAFDAVVIVDADTVVVPEFAEALVARRGIRDIAQQGYIGVSNEDSWLSVLGMVLSLVRYRGQYLLKERAGLNTPLLGNGMCLGVDLLRRRGWAHGGSLTEDWELYARYTSFGERIRYVPGARLHAQEPKSLGQSSTQRLRWDVGKFAVLRSYWGQVLRSRAIGFHQKLDVISELAVPGPVLHASLVLVVGVPLLIVGWTPARVVGLLLLLSLLPLVAWTVRSLFIAPRPLRALGAFLGLPLYAAWRLGVVVVALVSGRKLGWQRSPRHASKRAA